jgi:hypothetical protein
MTLQDTSTLEQNDSEMAPEKSLWNSFPTMKQFEQ